MALRLWLLLRPRVTAEHVTTVYETLERPLVECSRSMERRGISIDRQVLSRLSGEFAQRAAALEAEIQKLAGEPLNPGSPKQLGDILFGKFGLPGGTKTKTGALVDRRARARGACRAGPRAAAENPRLAAGFEAAFDLYRRAAGLRQSDDASRAHELRARRDHRPAARRPPSRTCRTSRSAPRRAARSAAPSWRRAGHEARLRRLFADRAAAAGRDRQHRAAEEGVPRRPRHSTP